MIQVQYPEPNFKIEKEGNSHRIFDAIRKTWLKLTDEEWVRQNFIAYLIQVMKYPMSRIALEKGIIVNDMRRRFDILIYNEKHHPWMMIECKAPSISLNDEVLQQVLRYNISVPVTYLIITNGAQTIGWQKSEGGLVLLQSLPTL